MVTYGFPVWMFSEPGLSVAVWIARIAILTVFTVMVWWWAGKALPPAAVVDKKIIEEGTWRSLGHPDEHEPGIEQEPGIQRGREVIIAGKFAYNRTPLFETVTIRAFVLEFVAALLSGLIFYDSGTHILSWLNENAVAFPFWFALLLTVCFVVALGGGAGRQLFQGMLYTAGAIPAVDSQGQAILVYLGDVPPFAWLYSPWPRAGTWLIVSFTSLVGALLASILLEPLFHVGVVPIATALLVLRWFLSPIPWRIAKRQRGDTELTLTGSDAEVEMSEAQEAAIHQPPTPSHFADAEAAVKEAEKSGRKDAGVVEALTNLVNLYVHQSRYAEAEPLVQRALDIQEEILGHEHPEVATSLYNLADLYREQGHYAEAEPLHKRALAIREKALGPEHPQVGTSLNNLALLA